MIVAAELTMRVPETVQESQWRGRARHIKTRTVADYGWQYDRARAVLGRHTYDFGDGWVATLRLWEVGEREAAHLRRLSRGFAGYDWMLASLLSLGKIVYQPSLFEDAAGSPGTPDD